MTRQAVLLLGGRGTRMWPLSATRPKGLLPVAGIPFVEFQLRLLAEAGVEEAILAVGTEHREAWEAFAGGEGRRPRVEVVVEEEPLDTGGQVAALAGELEERFWVLNGDVLFDARLADLAARAPDLPAVLTLARVEDPSAFGVVVADEEGRVIRFVEKPEPGTAPADTVSAGIYLLRPEALAGFGPGSVSFEREVWPHLAEGGRLGAVVAEGLWMDIGTPALYLDAHRRVLGGESRLHRPEQPHATGEGAAVAGRRHGSWSWIGPGGVVEEGATVAEAVVLDGARLRAGAAVRGAVVGWDSEVGPGAVVEDEALVGEGCWIGPECEIGRGMRVAPGIRLGERAVSFSPPP